MENNEIIMNEENEVMDDIYVADENTGISKNAVIAIAMVGGAALAFAGKKLGEYAKGAFAKWKAKKELRQPEEEIVVEPEQVEEVVAK